MPIQPSGQQLEQLASALLKAFDHDELARLVRSQFDQSLEWITPVAGKRDLTTITSDLVVYFASQENGLKKLLAAAIRENPLSPDLSPIAVEWFAIEFAPLPLSPEHPHANIDTGGGAYVEGNVSVENGDFVGGNKIVYENASPLDLSKLEQAYLKGLYADCNELLLANDGPVDQGSKRQPRMQRVYVELDVTESLTAELLHQRLALQNVDLDELFERLDEHVKSRAVSEEIHRSDEFFFSIASRNLADPKRVNPSPDFLQMVDKETLNEIANEFNTTPETLHAAFANSTVLEAIQANPQLVILGDPGTGALSRSFL